MRIDCSPRDLLRNYGEWGKVRADLEQFGDNVPLGSLAKELSDSVTRLYRAILEGEAPLYIASGECVVRLLVEVDSPGEHGAIAEVGPYEDGKQDVSFVEPPLDVLRLMGMIVDETG